MAQQIYSMVRKVVPSFYFAGSKEFWPVFESPACSAFTSYKKQSPESKDLIQELEFKKVNRQLFWSQELF